MTRLILLVLYSLVLFSNPAHSVFEPAKTGQQESYGNNDDGMLRKGRELPEQRFTDNLDGTLTDNLTGLIWISDAYCANHFISGAASGSWQDAFEYVKALNNNTLISFCRGYSGQFDDWRVPNINELQSLIPKGLENQSSILNWLTTPGNSSNGFSEATLAVLPAWSSTTDSTAPEKAWVSI